MAGGSKLCGECRKVNSLDAETCFYCGSRFPGPLGAKLSATLTGVLGRELPMTTFFLGLCSLVFALTLLDSRQLDLLGSSSRWPVLRWGAIIPRLVPSEPWRLLSATFVHLGVVHFAFNMFALVDLGKRLERELGSPRFGVLFVTTATSGFLLSQLWYASVLGMNTLTAGASGGLFGLSGALIGSLYARRDPEWKQIAVRFGLYALLFAVMMPVNNAAHAGGFILGAPLGYLMRKERRPASRQRLFRVLAALCVAASLGSVVASAASPHWKRLRAIEAERR